MFDTTTTSLGIGVTGTDHPSSNLYITGNAYVSSNIAVGGVLTMGTVNVVARHDLESVTATGNTTPLTVEFQNADTSLVASGNVETKNINMLHTANTASIKLNSNVTTEFSRSKKLIKYPRVALGTNSSAHSGVGTGGSTVSGYTIKASSEYNGDYLASKAFTNTNDNDVDTWISSVSVYSSNLPVANSATLTKFGQQGSWLEIKLPNAIQLHFTRIFNRRTHVLERNETADIWASNTGNDGEWVKLTTINFNDSYTDIVPMEAEIDTQTYYQYFAIQITKIAWSTGTYANIGEWELYGVPEYDPEAHGTDVTLKSVPNVPNTDWLEVYYDAKGLPTGAVSNPISGLGGTTISATKLGDPQVSNDAFVFDGSGDAIVSGATSLIGKHLLSYSVWFKTNSISSGYGSNSIVQIGHSAGDKSLGFRIKGTGDTKPGNYRFYVWGGATNESVDTDIKAEIGTWTHATVVYDGLNSKLYIDGKFAAENTNTTTDLDLDSGAKVALGNYIDSNGALYSGGTVRDYDGSIANFRLFNRAITQDEIYQLYAYQKEYFGHGDLSMTFRAGRLGIGTSEPRAALDVREGSLNINGMTIAGNFPSSPPNSKDGTLYYDTTQRRLYVLEDGNWVSLMGDINNSTSFQPSDIANYYAHYQASNYSGGIISDLSGNGRNGTGTSGQTVHLKHAWHGEFGAKSYFATLYATESSGSTGKVSLHPDVLPPLFTIVALTRRYTPPDLAQIDHVGRVITFDNAVTSSHAANAGYGRGNNWLLGHWGDQSGVAFFNGWVSTNVSSGVSSSSGQYGIAAGSKWLISIGKPGYYASKVQGSDWNTNTISNTNNSGYMFDPICIGGGSYEPCHWEFAEMIVYDRELFDYEIEQLKRHMQAKYNIY
tara:strand:+ start:13 stop:2664 length:2652 start_codon:yes stop_codon:yes gene_type:complete